MFCLPCFVSALCSLLCALLTFGLCSVHPRRLFSTSLSLIPTVARWKALSRQSWLHRRLCRQVRSSLAAVGWQSTLEVAFLILCRAPSAVHDAERERCGEAMQCLCRSAEYAHEAIRGANDEGSQGPEERANDHTATNVSLPSMLYHLLIGGERRALRDETAPLRYVLQHLVELLSTNSATSARESLWLFVLRPLQRFGI